jgi:signal transduction histidine kinase
MTKALTVPDGHRITNEVGLQQTLEAIQMMEAALADLKQTVKPQSEKWFELMAEGTRDQIEKLRAEVNDYEARQESRHRRRA